MRDLGSTNGTFVNDQPMKAKTWRKPGDTIRAGPNRFVLGQDCLSKYDQAGGLRVEVLGLNKWVRADLNLLKDISLIFRPREFGVVVGQSGGQQKRVAIGVELLTRPGLFFLDEPSSGLDPGTETALLHLMRRLPDQGRTIILITYATKNVMLADQAVFLARGGYLASISRKDRV